MAYSSIVKPSVHFNTKLYTGNGTTNTPQTGVGFQPDWTWIKGRSVAFDNNVFDAVRGPTKRLMTNNENGETTANEMIKSFNSDGFTLGNDDGVNKNSDTFVAWNWKAGTGQGSSNTDGSINTTYTSVNTTAGFSISQWNGTEANATIGHGLGVAPSMIIIKNMEKTTSWVVYHKSLGATKTLYLSGVNAESASAVFFNNTEPTSTVFTVGTNDGVNGNGEKNIAYCFAEKKGYSKFGTYVGTDSNDGVFVYTGFKPAFIMVKSSSSGSTYSSWSMFDTTRQPFNVNAGKTLYANRNYQEGKRGQGDSNANSPAVDMLSNGFKFRYHADEVNNSSTTYIYMAFAENPLVANSGTDGVPATAR